MIATGVTRQQMEEALSRLNSTSPFAKEGQRFYFRSFRRLGGTRFRFTLGANSHKPGSRYSVNGRRTPSACWHAHGQFFELLFELAPDAKVRSSMLREPITAANPYPDVIIHGPWLTRIDMRELCNH